MALWEIALEPSRDTSYRRKWDMKKTELQGLSCTLAVSWTLKLALAQS